MGYHGDDGSIYLGTGKGHSFGPTYTEGDVVGCGINFISKVVFFTKNGAFVGENPYPLSCSKDHLYAGFGMKSPGECVKANFGFEDFAFDIKEYISRHQKAHTDAILKSIPVGNLQSPSLELLVLRHLIHSGCEETVHSFCRSAFGEHSSLIDMDHISSLLARSKLRRQICNLIVQRKTDECLQLLQEHYPGVRSDDFDIDFLLDCTRFIEAVTGDNRDEPETFARILVLGQAVESKLSKTSRSDFQPLARDALALIAYKNPESSPSGYLLKEEHRMMIASELERVLLEADDVEAFGPLEKLIRALMVDMEVLRELGDKDISLIEPLAQIIRSGSAKPE